MKLLNSEYGKSKSLSVLILTMFMILIPLIIYLHLVIVSSEAQKIWSNIDINFFTFLKMNFILFFGFLILLIFVTYIYKNKFIISYYYIPIILYGVLIILSSIYSDYISIVKIGFPTINENLFLLLIYAMLTVISLNILYEKDTIKFVLSGLFFSAFILGFIGIMQYFGFDIFATEFGNRLITPSGLQGLVENNLPYINKNRSYATLGNPNYVGSYGSMLVALTLGLYFNFKNKLNIFAIGFLSVLMFAFLNGSKSRAGFVGFLAGLIFLIILNKKVIIKNWKRAVIIFLAFTMVFIAMDSRSIDEIFKDIVSPMSEEELVEEELILPPITNVESNMNHLVLETREVGFNIYFEDDSIQLLDDNNQQLYYNYNEEDKLSFGEERYSDHEFRKNTEENQLIWEYDNKEAVFKYKDGQVFMQGMNNNLYELKEVSSWGFEGYERLGSSRGYIWSRSIPLLKDTIIIGHGPDTYAMYFPQEDVIGKLKFLRSPGIIVDKPHNMYLQIAINTGIISLLALLVLWGGYIIEGIRLYWNADYDRWENKVGVSILAAVVAYLVTGIFNDSVVSVAPVFWILLGIGISMNLKLKNR